MGEGSDGGGKLAGEFVVGEEEELESGEVGEGGNGTVETVAFKAEDAELGEEGEGEDGAGEVEVFEDEAGDAAAAAVVVVVVVEAAGDAVPGAGVGGRGVPLREEFVGRACLARRIKLCSMMGTL